MHAPHQTSCVVALCCGVPTIVPNSQSSLALVLAFIVQPGSLPISPPAASSQTITIMHDFVCGYYPAWHGLSLTAIEGTAISWVRGFAS